MSIVQLDIEQRDALSLRVAELSAMVKQQRSTIEEQQAGLQKSRKQLRENEEVIRMQEAQLIERDGQIECQKAELRALRKQHQADVDALRAAHEELFPGPRSRRGPSSPSSRAAPSSTTPSSPHSPRRRQPSASPLDASVDSGGADKATKTLRKQLQQALNDKVVLVKALHELTSQLAQARAEVRKHAEASERSLSTAWRLGQLGQLGLSLLEANEDEIAAGEAIAALDEVALEGQQQIEGGGDDVSLARHVDVTVDSARRLREAAFHAGVSAASEIAAQTVQQTGLAMGDAIADLQTLQAASVDALLDTDPADELASPSEAAS